MYINYKKKYNERYSTILNLYSLVVLFLVFFQYGLVFSQENVPELDIDVTEGVVEPIPIAFPNFITTDFSSSIIANEISKVVKNDLLKTALFRIVPEGSYISDVTSIDSPVRFADWRAINSDLLVVGDVSVINDTITIKFRLWDVVGQNEIFKGVQFKGPSNSIRRIAHKVSDLIYSGVTGEGKYFDTRIAFISERGPKNNRTKRLAIMDQDGANLTFLTDSESIVLAPRFSPDSRNILYTSYETGKPRVYLMNLINGNLRSFPELPGMTFAPRFSPDGKKIILSITENGNTDIYTLNLENNLKKRLTKNVAIDTAPSYSPDGKFIVFESDRGGNQQIYVMPSEGGKAKRISFGKGRYGTPVWSPRGDMIAFTKMYKGNFHIGVMRKDGSQERLLTKAFIDEGPTWAPNGRILMFFRETSGVNGAPSLHTIEVTGRNLRKIELSSFASDPSWSSLLK